MNNKKAILVISFGTSYQQTLNKTIKAIENDISDKFSEYEVRRAFTSGKIIEKLKKRDNIHIDNVTEALERLIEDGFDTVVCQPTHVMNGFEYDDMVSDIKKYKNKFKSLKTGLPLITSFDDYSAVAKAIIDEFSYVEENEALILMGHGTEHHANAAYACLDYKFKDEGGPNIFVGTVEGYPEIDSVMKRIKYLNPSKVWLAPLMVVAGDHAINDMAGDDEDSWKPIIEKEGFDVEPVLRGLGEYKTIRHIYLSHVDDAIKEREGN